MVKLREPRLTVLDEIVDYLIWFEVLPGLNNSDLARVGVVLPEAAPPDTSARSFGARWIRAKRSVAIQTPSAVLPCVGIFLLNPEHADFSKAVGV